MSGLAFLLASKIPRYIWLDDLQFGTYYVSPDMLSHHLGPQKRRRYVSALPDMAREAAPGSQTPAGPFTLQ